MVFTPLPQAVLISFLGSEKPCLPNNRLPSHVAPSYPHTSQETSLAVNFKKVIENAQQQGVDLQQITIQYENLTEEEIKLLGNHQVITHNSGSTVLAKFPEDGMPILQAKAEHVIYLGA